ncbi:hypothetical protein O9K51_08609 [Purpureocillium lavendulum]|uniref:Uncharacterized protein n=1 Tax=Purpureocillium lavendulum TaxID=1247861 RepID=A0AB34FJG5_9HYPO|nr:hypothetical protein O9K51_08609 [Purpureocillium lavendulum]
MKIDCEVRFGSGHLQEGSKLTLGDTDVAAAEKEKASPTFAPTRNTTAADNADMIRQEKLGGSSVVAFHGNMACNISYTAEFPVVAGRRISTGPRRLNRLTNNKWLYLQISNHPQHEAI